MGALFLFCVALAAAASRWYELDDSYTFERYIAEHRKSYGALEYTRRSKIFAKTLAIIRAHNAENHPWKMGVNRFTDMTEKERKRFLGGHGGMLHKEVSERGPVSFTSKVAAGTPLPLEKDWRREGVITAVKDQGGCGSCWTFGSSSTIESYVALATGNLPVLSQQYIIDCTPNPNQCGGVGGCQGATASLAIDTVKKLGIPQEFTYPYTSYFVPGNSLGMNTCRNTSAQNFAPFSFVDSQVHLPSNQEAPVLEALATTGPLITNVDASSWFLYESGVYTGCSANSTIDHVVQLVGYGFDKSLGLSYFLVRNSWNPTFGENGYIRLVRQTTCGWDLQPGQGKGCEGGPKSVQVCGQCGVLYSNSYVIVKKNQQ